jgi:hypothetical protein
MKALRFLLPAGALALVFSYGSLTGWGAPPEKVADKDKVVHKEQVSGKDKVADKHMPDKVVHKEVPKDLQKGAGKEFPKGGTTVTHKEATQK